MQTQPKYQSEVKTVVMGERTITIKNLKEDSHKNRNNRNIQNEMVTHLFCPKITCGKGTFFAIINAYERNLRTVKEHSL